jgi:hypothetical protein
MISKPVFVLVHAAWHGPKTMDQVASILAERGYESHTITYPSVGTPTPVQTMDPDTESVRKGVAAQLEAGKDVVVAMHSYAAYPGSEAMKYFLPNNGGTGGGRIVRLVYLSGFLPIAGTSFLDIFGGKPSPMWAISVSLKILEQNCTNDLI